jgi:ATP-binding cassette, subfamily B, multidrug efflux pump
MKHLAYLNKYFFKYKWHLLGGMLFVLISNLFRVLQPQMLRNALDLVFDNITVFRMANGFAIQKNMLHVLGSVLMTFGILMLIFALMMGIFMYLMRQTIIVMSRLIEYDLRKEIFDKYQLLNTSFYKRNNTGDMMSRISEDVSKVRMYLGPAILYGFNLITIFVLVISTMIKVNPMLTFYSLMPLPILIIVIYIVSAAINRRSERIQQQLSILTSTAQETYSGIRVVKSYVQEKAMLGHFTDQSNEYMRKSMRLAQVDNAFFPVMLMLVGTCTIITVYVGGLQVVDGSISPGNIAEFVIYINMLTWPVTSIGWIASLTQQASASQKRINEFLKDNSIVANLNDPIGKIEGNIQFKNVTFEYPDTGIKALKNINFEIKKGEKLAILGKTGSGKTTIAELLLRMYDVQNGEILIDNKNMNTLDFNNLRKQIGYVPQDVFLFSDSVEGNIAFGKKESTLDEVKSFAKYASVYNDIIELKEGFETIVGERGVTLSGGQKQRISIARALIKKPTIVILDDCLSAVDTKTEQQIVNYLDANLKNKTTIIITHRINTSLKFDNIIVLDEGEIIESGTHEQLIKNQGYYYDLFEKEALETAQNS